MTTIPNETASAEKYARLLSERDGGTWELWEIIDLFLVLCGLLRDLPDATREIFRGDVYREAVKASVKGKLSLSERGGLVTVPWDAFTRWAATSRKIPFCRRKGYEWHAELLRLARIAGKPLEGLALEVARVIDAHPDGIKSDAISYQIGRNGGAGIRAVINRELKDRGYRSNNRGYYPPKR